MDFGHSKLSISCYRYGDKDVQMIKQYNDKNLGKIIKLILKIRNSIFRLSDALVLL